MYYPIFMIIGFAAGVLGGLLGVGGSIIMLPAMIAVLGTGRQHDYQAAAMIVNAFVVAPSLLAHRKAGAISASLVRWLIPSALIGIFLGVWISNFFPREQGRYLAKGLGVFLLYVAIFNFFRLFSKAPPEQEGPAQRSGPWWRVSLVGLPMGLVGGLFGIGGGVLGVPFQQIFLRVPIKNAIANSAATICITALAGAIYKNATLPGVGGEVSQSLQLAAILIPTAFLGGFIGGKLTHALPKRAVRVALILLMLAASWKMWHATPGGVGGGQAAKETSHCPSEQAPAVATGLQLGIK